MQVLRVSSLAALLAVVSGAAVVDLTAENFDRLTRNGDWMVEFYAPWCGHCKKLAPVWEQAANSLAGNVNFGKVDCTKYRSLGTRFGINGYPTIYHIKESEGADPEVRKAPLQHNLQSITSYAQGGWRSMTPLTGVANPMGTVAKAKFGAMKIGDIIIAIQQPIADLTGLPIVVVQFLEVLFGLLGVTCALIGFAVWLGPKQHRD